MKKILFLAIAGLLASCGNKHHDMHSDQTAAKKAGMQRFYDEVINAHNPAMVDSFCTPDFVDYQADPNYPPGLPGLKAWFTDFFAAFPDIHFATNWMVASGDTVVAHFTMTGTHNGPFMGMAPTGKPIKVDGVDVVVINKDGKATTHWGYSEDSKFMQQLGMMGGGAPADSTAVPKN